MSGRKLWYMLTLLAFVMLPLAGCGGTSGTSAVSKDGYKLTVSGNVAGGKSLLKTLFAAAPDLGTITVLNAQDGTTVGTGAIDSTGKFSNLLITLPAAKSVLVFKADVSLAGSPFRTILPIDLSTPPAVAISANNSINIEISQNSTNIATAVSAMLGVTGLLGDAGATLAAVNKTYSDVAQQVVSNGGKVYAYTTNGPEIIGSLQIASLLPAKDASTLTFDDLRDIALSGKIISAFIPGNSPIVNFQVVNKSTGKGISGLRTFSLHIAQLNPEIAGSNSYWMNYLALGLPLSAMPGNTERGASTQTVVINPTVDAATVFNSDGSVKIPGYTVIDHGDGSYTATFGANIKANTNVLYDAALTHRIAIGVRSVAVPGVVGKTTGAYAGPIAKENYGGITANTPMGSFANTNGTALIYDFYPNTGASVKDASGNNTFARDIVTIAACNQCHGRLEHGSNNTSGHFGSRPDTKLCVVCHTPQLAAGAGDFKSYIHKIHMGSKLPAAETSALTTTLVDVSKIILPMDPRNCTICHKGIDVDNWMSKPTRSACGSCHNSTDFLTHKGSQTNDLACVGCHQEAAGALKPVSVAHATDYATPNNPQTPAGLVNFKYDLKSVTVDASNQAVITFRILSDGGTGAAKTSVTFNNISSTASPLLTGFTGSPGFILAYNKSATNQAFTTSPDYNNLGVKAAQPISVAINALAATRVGKKGTLAGPDANGYYTGTITTAASNFPTDSKMRTVALQGYFSQTTAPASVAVANGRHTISDVKTVTGDTKRRVVIDSGKCGACHEVFEGHGGNRNIGKDTVGEAVCTLCHVPNLSTSGKGIDPKYVTSTNAAYLTALFSDPVTSALLTTWASKVPGFIVDNPTTYPEETNNFKDMIHGIHAGSSRANPLTFVRDSTSRGTITFFDTSKIKFPSVLKNCEACHTSTSYRSIPATAQVTTDLTTPLNADGTVVTTFDTTNNVATVSKGRTLLPNANDLVTTPFTAACVSCHDLPTSKAHMVGFGGQIKVARNAAVVANETCITCHGVTGTVSIFNSHRF